MFKKTGSKAVVNLRSASAAEVNILLNESKNQGWIQYDLVEGCFASFNDYMSST